MRASERLAEIQTRAGKATDGPWTTRKHRELEKGPDARWIYPGNVVAADSHQIIVSQTGNAANTEFIAHARTDVPHLVAAVQAFFDATREHRDRDRLGCECPACEGYHAACAALEL